MLKFFNFQNKAFRLFLKNKLLAFCFSNKSLLFTPKNPVLNNLFLGLIFTILSCTGGTKNLKINRGETFFNNLASEPESLHPIRSTDYYARVVQHYILEKLLQQNKDSNKWEPLLAKKWTISPNNKIFTFELYDNLKWSDGKPLTTKDVKFSFEAYKNPEYGGIHGIPYYEKIDSAKVLSPTKIQFKAKTLYFGNFQVIASMKIIPQHIYKDPKARLSKTLIGSGPYKLSAYIKGKILVLKQNPLWEGKNHSINKGKWQFKTIAFRFIESDVDTLLRMEKQHIDFTRLSTESFYDKTNKPPWGVELKKVKYKNKEPAAYGFIGFNFKKPIFQDQKVRLALAHLINRDLMNKKFAYNQTELARGPWYFWSDYADKTVKPIRFNPKKALEILKQAGWEDKDKNGLLEKTIQGKKTEFIWTLIYPNPDKEKYLTLYQQDLKQAGIKLNLKILDWASFLKLLDDKSFDAAMLGWSGGSIDFDPKQIWHTKSAQTGGSNFISYSNPEVDALIDKGRSQMDKKERVKIFKKIYRLIANDVPYIFLFNNQNKYYGLNNRVNSPADSFNYSRGDEYWSLKANP